MKISLVCPASLPATQFGGIMFLCVHIANRLSRLGHQVTIYTTDLDFANDAKTFNRNLPREEHVNQFSIKRTHVWFSIFLFYMNLGMYRQMAKDDHDIIHTVGVRSFQSLIAALISKRKKIPLIVSDQGGLTTHPDLQKSSLLKQILIKLQNPMIRYVINQSSRVIVANEYERQIFLNFCDETKIEIVRNGIDLNELNSECIDFKSKYKISGEFILFVGRFSMVKGVDLLLQAINRIKHHPEMSNVKTVIMGVDFGFEKKMFEMVEELHLREKVVIIRNPDRNDVISAYAQCKFLVLPSRWELSPLTPLEGFAFKRAVISSKAHGIPFTIEHGKNALLVEPEDYQKLGDAIMELIRDEIKCTEYGINGYNLVTEICNSDKMADNIFKVYQNTINR